MIPTDGIDIDVEIQLSYPTSNTEGKYVSIRLTDDEACTQFTELKIPFAQFTALLSSSQVTVPATMRGLDRIGKRMEVDETHVGFDAVRAEQVKASYLAAGWDTAEIRGIAGGGRRVLARRWVDKTNPTI